MTSATYEFIVVAFVQIASAAILATLIWLAVSAMGIGRAYKSRPQRGARSSV